MGGAVASFVHASVDAVVGVWATPCRIALLGLDNAGSTTLLHQLVHHKVGAPPSPTFGFCVETFVYKRWKFTAWDIGGHHVFRLLWPRYVNDTRAVVFVIDAADRARIAEAADELRKLFQLDDLRDAVLLVLANKQDVLGAMAVAEVDAALELGVITANASHVQATVATTREGVDDGLDWLCSALSSRPRSRSRTPPNDAEVV